MDDEPSIPWYMCLCGIAYNMACIYCLCKI